MADKISKIKGKSNKKLTMRQRRYVKNVMSGMSKRKAALEAGYSQEVCDNTRTKIDKFPSVQEAFRVAMKEAGIDDKSIVRVLKEGLSATNLNGKDAVEHVDHRTRLSFVEYINKMRGIDAAAKVDVTSGGKAISFGLDKLLNPTNEEVDPDSEDQEDK